MVTGVTREIRLESTPRAARDARQFVVRVFAEMGYPKGLVEDAELMVSELVTNCLAHAPGGSIVVDIWRIGPCLFLEVWDRSTQPPVCLTSDELTANGRGLHIVKELSLGFGYSIFPGGKVVWALLGVMQDAYLTWRPQMGRNGHCGSRIQLGVIHDVPRTEGMWSDDDSIAGRYP
jgi:anti-sigma regulatory factor (Ser/Thr protein kinase)